MGFRGADPCGGIRQDDRRTNHGFIACNTGTPPCNESAFRAMKWHESECLASIAGTYSRPLSYGDRCETEGSVAGTTAPRAVALPLHPREHGAQIHHSFLSQIRHLHGIVALEIHPALRRILGIDDP